MKSTVRSLTIAVLLACGGCAVGPDFKRPGAPATASYVAGTLPDQTVATPAAGGQAQRFVHGQAIQSQWWKLFGSPALDELVEVALLANPDLQAAEAALRAAHSNAAAQRGAFWPRAELQLLPLREKPDADTSPYRLHTGQLNISYAPDLFGANRRQTEVLVAELELQQFEREAVYMTLVSSVVNAAIEEASLRAQIAATREIIGLSTRLLDISRRQHRVGQIGGAEVVSQEVALAQMQVSLPPLEKQLAEQRNLLAVLAGRLPSDKIQQRFELDELTLPTELPLSLPAQLVEQRPDIRAAQAQLHAASAAIGVAIAARLPNLTLTASSGRSGASWSQLTGSGAGFWAVGADLLQPIFQGRALLHQQRAAQATYDQAAAQYRSTVLTAFQDTADTLQAIVSDAQTLQAATVAHEAAQRSLVMVERQRELGAVSQADVVLAQQAYQEAVMGWVEARASRYSNTVALFHALGGGWWQTTEARVATDAE